MFISKRDLKNLRDEISDLKKNLYRLDVKIWNVAKESGLTWSPSQDGRYIRNESLTKK